MGQYIAICGYHLTEAECMAAAHLSAKRAIGVPPNAWGTQDVFTDLSHYGIASKCGRLFHVTPRCDRIAAEWSAIRREAA